MAALVTSQKNDELNNVDKQYDIDNILNDIKLQQDKFQFESSPITCCCILGDTDTGKTMLRNCIRGQQIGATTYLSPDYIRQKTKVLIQNVTGLLLIDTPPPGHESFNKLLRSSQIAVLVVNIMHGLQPQTIEALHLLRSNNIKFVVAVNKVDSLYVWKTCLDEPIWKTMMMQDKYVKYEFNSRLDQIITQFKEQGFDTELFNKNKHKGETYRIVPTSAISGEGIPELLLLLFQCLQMTINSYETPVIADSPSTERTRSQES